MVNTVRGLCKPIRKLIVDIKPSPKQWKLWKLLQPDECPHCGGHILQKMVGYDERGNPKYQPYCNKCGSTDLPQLILGGGAAGKQPHLPAFTVMCRTIAL